MAMIVSRELSAQERDALAAHLLALGPEDRRLRFGTPLGDEGVRDYAARIDFERDAVFGVFDAELRLVGVAHLARAEEFAELGVSVLPGHRGQGVGEALLARAHLQARNWGVETLLMHCLAENRSMKHLAVKRGMRLASEAGEVAATVEVPPASPSSVVTQMLAENIGLFDYAIKAQLLAARRAMGMGKDRIPLEEEVNVEKIWLKSYPKGVPAEINASAYRSVPHLIDENMGKYRGRPAYMCMGKTLSFGDVDRLSTRFGAWLQSRGLAKGARVAVMMPNVLQYPVAVFGILRAGLTVVNVNPLYTPRELEHQLSDSGAEAIVILENFATTLEQVLPKTQVKHIVVASLGDLLGVKGVIVNFVVRNVKKMVPAFDLPGAIRFNAAISEGAGQQLKKIEVGPDDIAFLQYTGGTTGVSKGAMLLHRNVVANMEQVSAWFSPTRDEANPHVMVAPLPLYHIYALTANCLFMLRDGGCNLLIPNPRDIPGFIKELKSNRFTAFSGLNTLYNALLNHPEFSSIDFSHLRLAAAGGMAMQKAVAERWHKATKVPILEGYGLTETSPVATTNPVDLKEFSGTIGLPVPSTTITIRDDDENILPTGQVGEICIAGPQVMKGYWKRPEETAKVMAKDGAFKTGDIGVMDERGYVKIVDRKKDMILVSGFNVYPNELEDVVASCPGVLECCAIGVPDEKSGEVPKVFVVKKDPGLTEDKVMEYCRKNLTGYKVPKFIEFRAELPKTNVGKILRRALRDEALKKG